MQTQDGAIVDRLFGALASGDLDAALACLTPDARVWHSFDGIAQDRTEALAGWQALVANFPERAFVDVRRHAISGGFVQQQLLVCRTASGQTMAWPVCVVIRLEDGLIARVDEYIDRAGKFAVEDLQRAVTPGL